MRILLIRRLLKNEQLLDCLLTGLLLESLYKQNNQLLAGRRSEIIAQVIASLLLDGLAIGLLLFIQKVNPKIMYTFLSNC